MGYEVIKRDKPLGWHMHQIHERNWGKSKRNRTTSICKTRVVTHGATFEELEVILSASKNGEAMVITYSWNFLRSNDRRLISWWKLSWCLNPFKSGQSQTESPGVFRLENALSLTNRRCILDSSWAGINSPIMYSINLCSVSVCVEMSK